MDYVSGLTPYPITYNTPPFSETVISSAVWEDVAGIAKKSFLVIQVHDKIYIVDRSDTSLNSTSSVKRELSLYTNQQVVSKASFAAVNGFLVVAYGNETVKVIEYVAATDSFGIHYCKGQRLLICSLQSILTLDQTPPAKSLSPQRKVGRIIMSMILKLRMRRNTPSSGWAIA
jgi:hypothetical protein